MARNVLLVTQNTPYTIAVHVKTPCSKFWSTLAAVKVGKINHESRHSQHKIQLLFGIFDVASAGGCSFSAFFL